MNLRLMLRPLVRANKKFHVHLRNLGSTRLRIWDKEKKSESYMNCKTGLNQFEGDVI